MKEHRLGFRERRPRTCDTPLMRMHFRFFRRARSTSVCKLLFLYPDLLLTDVSSQLLWHALKILPTGFTLLARCNAPLCQLIWPHTSRDVRYIQAVYWWMAANPVLSKTRAHAKNVYLLYFFWLLGLILQLLQRICVDEAPISSLKSVYAFPF